MLNSLLRLLVWGLLKLRYRVEIRGLAAIVKRGTHGVLFLPTHPALIDPVMVVATLHKWFTPRVLADFDAVNMPGMRNLAQRFGVRTFKEIAKYGQQGRDELQSMLGQSVADLQQGENLLLYPAGRILRNRLEEVGGNSSVETILHQAPQVRVVLLRTRGLWGSSFGFARTGRDPQVGSVLLKGLLTILANGIFFTPRRRVTLEFVEPSDFPRNADRATINRYLEAFYNENAPSNTYVPYTIWERGDTRSVPEPEGTIIAGNIAAVPERTRQTVTAYLTTMSGISTLHDKDRLSGDLALDSLARAELMVWLESEFGFPQGGADSLRTVGDVLLAACGEAVAISTDKLKPVPPTWFTAGATTKRLQIPAAETTITGAFLRQARQAPNKPLIADQAAGVKTNRDIVTAILALVPQLRKLPGECLGIMLPASVMTDIIYLATLFSGKTPVMINWTVGWRSLQHSLDLAGVQQVLTAQQLTTRLATQGTDLSGISDRFVYLETLGGQISRGAKLRAWLMAQLSWRQLWKAAVPDIAAILFTSGSENLPKAVPLSHANLLANLRDVLEVVNITEGDTMLGMLPPFHSFGLTGNMLFALCSGLRTVYHANPTEGPLLAQLIEAYQASMVIGTPTFVNGIMRAATPQQLSSLRLAVTGAEECPQRVYDLLRERCLQVVALEGYGITECSPIVALNDEHAPRPFTIGRLLPSLRAAIVHPQTGDTVEKGATGLLLLRGPSIFSGYLGVDVPNPFVEHDGEQWYRTGDLVSMDADGVLTFRGRLKRFVKIGGEMISLPAIESVLQAAFAADSDGPALAVVATVNAERPELVLFTLLPIDRETVNRQIRDAGLSGLHNIRQVICLHEIPLLGTGKTDYRALQTTLESTCLA